MVTLEGFWQYGKLNPGEDTVIARLCLDAAIEAAEGAGVPMAGNETSAEYAEYVYMLALEYYENRGGTPSSQAYAVDEYSKRANNSRRIRLALKAAQRKEVAEDGE